MRGLSCGSWWNFGHLDPGSVLIFLLTEMVGVMCEGGIGFYGAMSHASYSRGSV